MIHPLKDLRHKNGCPRGCKEDEICRVCKIDDEPQVMESKQDKKEK